MFKDVIEVYVVRPFYETYLYGGVKGTLYDIEIIGSCMKYYFSSYKKDTFKYSKREDFFSVNTFKEKVKKYV